MSALTIYRELELELEWQVLIPGFPAYPHTTLFRSRKQIVRKPWKLRTFRVFSNHYLLLSKRKCDMIVSCGKPKERLFN
jgi:hypothetical protein